MPRDVCYFDGRCGLCRRSTRILKRLDWLGRLAFDDLTAIPARDLPVPIETALRGMPMRTREGRVLVGFPASRRALLQTPLGVVPALLMYLPVLSDLGRRTYNHIATHRKRDEACRVEPARPAT